MSVQSEMIQKQLLEANMETELAKTAERIYGKSLKDCSEQELYYVLLSFTKDLSKVTDPIVGEKKVYYISAEFLIGKLLSNNLINLGIYDRVNDILKANGKDLA